MEEFPVPTESEAATFWPFLLLVAALAVGYWFWSSTTTSATSAAAPPLPNAEELRKKRLEALSKAAPAPPPPAADAPSQQPVAVNGAPAPSTEERMLSRAKEEGLRLRREAETKTETTKPPSPPASQVPAAAAQAETHQKIEKDLKAKDLSVPSTKEDAVPAVPKDAAGPKDDVSKTVSSLALRARATLQGKSQVRNVEVPVEANVEQLQTEILKAFPEAADSKARVGCGVVLP